MKPSYGLPLFTDAVIMTCSGTIIDCLSCSIFLSWCMPSGKFTCDNVRGTLILLRVMCSQCITINHFQMFNVIL